MSSHMGLKPSPFAPAKFPDLPAIAGVEIGVAASGERYKRRDDLLVMSFPKGTTAAGVYTLSQMPSAPIDWCRKIGSKGRARGLVVSAGNANAFTGKAGAAAVKALSAQLGTHLKAPASSIFNAATGVIGEVPNLEKLLKGVDKAVKACGKADWEQAANAIRTTDTFPKGAGQTLKLSAKETVHIAGIVKGSGMIEPQLGTMLGFIATDAKIDTGLLDKMLRKAVDPSFNAISPDTDTSTSDTILVFATGAAGGKLIKAQNDPRARQLQKALNEICHDLAQQVVRDGEGVQKLIEVTVTGARTQKSAMAIAKAVVNSPLVKTAVAGEDPNWGRVVMAIGKAGEPANRDKLAIQFGPHPIAKKGAVLPGYKEAPVAKYMKGREIAIAIDVGVGKASATCWGCDLTHDYISINADYRS